MRQCWDSLKLLEDVATCVHSIVAFYIARDEALKLRGSYKQMNSTFDSVIIDVDRKEPKEIIARYTPARRLLVDDKGKM